MDENGADLEHFLGRVVAHPVLREEEVPLVLPPAITVLREEKAKPTAPPPDDTGALLERFVDRVAAHPIDDRLLLHGLGDPYGKKSGFEGSSIETTWSYRLNLLRDQIQVMEEVARSSRPGTDKAGTALLPSLHSLKLLEKKLERSLDLRKELVASPEQFGAALAKQMEHSRAEKESFLLPFTWPKHAVALEFVPTDLNSWSLRIYNTGAGSEWHSEVVAGTERFSAPFVEIKEVSKDQLLNPLFLSALHDIDHAEDTDVGATNLYYAVRLLVDDPQKGRQEGVVSRASKIASGILGGGTPPQEFPLQKPQHSGTCSFRVLDAIFLSFFGQLPTAEHFYWTEQLALLSAYFGQHKEELHKNEASFRNFKQGLVEFAALSEQLVKKGVITDKEAFIALKKIEPMQLAVEGAQREFEQTSLHTAPVTLTFGPLKPCQLSNPETPPLQEKTQEVGKVPKDSFSWPKVEGPHSPSSLRRTLRSLIAQSRLSMEQKQNPSTPRRFQREWSTGRPPVEDYAVHRAIQRLMGTLPSPEDPFWERIPSDQVDGMISELNSVREVFQEALLYVEEADSIGAEVEAVEFLTFFKFLTYIDRLSQRTSLEGREVPNLYDPWLVGLLEGKNAFFQPLDPLAADEMRKMANYWKTRTGGGEIPFFSSREGIQAERLFEHERISTEAIILPFKNFKPEDLCKGGLLPSLDWIKEWFAQKGKVFTSDEALLESYLDVFSGGSYEVKV